MPKSILGFTVSEEVIVMGSSSFPLPDEGSFLLLGAISWFPDIWNNLLGLCSMFQLPAAFVLLFALLAAVFYVVYFVHFLYTCLPFSLVDISLLVSFPDPFLLLCLLLFWTSSLDLFSLLLFFWTLFIPLFLACISGAFHGTFFFIILLELFQFLLLFLYGADHKKSFYFFHSPYCLFCFLFGTFL